MFDTRSIIFRSVSRILSPLMNAKAKHWIKVLSTCVGAFCGAPSRVMRLSGVVPLPRGRCFRFHVNQHIKESEQLMRGREAASAHRRRPKTAIHEYASPMPPVRCVVDVVLDDDRGTFSSGTGYDICRKTDVRNVSLMGWFS
jgi:hypothetical protein